MMNPNISGVEYQIGDTFGFWETRYFVFARDNYTCQICKKKGGILQTHHVVQRKDGGTDRAENLVTVHIECHEGFHQGKIKHVFKKPKLYKEPPFMNALRQYIFKNTNYKVTYGNVTTANRKRLGLNKSHSNDAIAITGAGNVSEDSDSFLVRQFRKKKRSLHEATARKGRKEPNRLSKRNNKNTKSAHGFFLNDKVLVNGVIGFVTGFDGAGVYVKNTNDKYIVQTGKSYKQVSPKMVWLMNHNNNWQFIPHLVTAVT